MSGVTHARFHRVELRTLAGRWMTPDPEVLAPNLCVLSGATLEPLHARKARTWLVVHPLLHGLAPCPPLDRRVSDSSRSPLVSLAARPPPPMRPSTRRSPPTLS